MNEGVKLAKLGANLIIEKKRADRRARRARRRKGYKTARADSQAANCACAVKKERERERVCVCVCMCVVEVEKSSSIYMMAVCLDRLLMGRKRVVVIKGTRDSIQWHTERPSRMR